MSDASQHNLHGAMLYQMGQYEEAIQALDRAIEIDGQCADAIYNKGICLKKLRRFEEAIDCFDLVLQIEPYRAPAWADKGDSLNALNRYREAIDCHDKALDLAPQDSFSWNNKAESLAKLGQYDGALRCYQQSLTIRHGQADVWYNMGCLLLGLQRPGDAIPCFEESLQIQPQNASTLTNMAGCLALLGKYQEAIRYYDKALQIDPGHTGARRNKDQLERLLGGAGMRTSIDGFPPTRAETAQRQQQPQKQHEEASADNRGAQGLSPPPTSDGVVAAVSPTSRAGEGMSAPADVPDECPHGHGPLRDWQGKPRCWTCGWPEKQQHSAQESQPPTEDVSDETACSQGLSSLTIAQHAVIEKLTSGENDHLCLRLNQLAAMVFIRHFLHDPRNWIATMYGIRPDAVPSQNQWAVRENVFVLSHQTLISSVLDNELVRFVRVGRNEFLVRIELGCREWYVDACSRYPDFRRQVAEMIG